MIASLYWTFSERLVDLIDLFFKGITQNALKLGFSVLFKGEPDGSLLWVPEALGKPSVAAFALFSAKLVVFHLSLLEERDVIYPEL